MKINPFFKTSRKLFKLPLYICLGAAVLLVCAQISLRYLLPMQSIQQKISAALSKTLNAEVLLDNVSAGLTGIKVKGINISIRGEELASATNAEVKISLLKLLKGDIDLKRVYIDKFNLLIIKNQNGSFNFDEMFSSAKESPQEEKQEQSGPADIYIKICQIKQGNISYIDKRTGAEAFLKDVFFDLEKFSFNKPFRISVHGKAAYKDNTSQTDVQDISFGFTLYPDLKNLNLQQALADIKLIIIQRGISDILLNGKVNNFINPQADVSVKINNFSGDTLKGIAEGINLNVNKAVLNVKADYNTELNRLTAQNIAVNISGGSFTLDKYNLSTDNLVLTFKGGGDFNKGVVSPDRLVLQTDNIKFSADKFTLNPVKAVLDFKGIYDIKQNNFSAEKLNLGIDYTQISLSGQKASVQKAVLDFKGSYEGSGEKITADSLNFESGQSKISAKGWFKNGKKLSYDLALSVNTLLAEIASFYPGLNPYKLKGTLNAELMLTQNNAKGKISLKNGGGYYEKAGTFEGINTSLNITSLKDINIPVLSGILNGNPFKAALTYKESSKTGNVNFNFQADKFILEDKTAVLTQYVPEDETVLNEDITLPEEVSKDWFLPPLNIKGNVEIGALDMPFLAASSVVFKTDLNNFTPDFDKLGGMMSLKTEEGIIKDLYKLTNSSAITKVLFLSLGVVSKVINSLDVMSILNKISKTVISGGKDETKPEKLKGALPYDEFEINLNFVDGITDITDGNFVSDLLSFDLSGQINFNNRKINMNVDAAPGRHEKGGIMPLRLKIGATVDNPSGSMSMLSSAANLLGQGVFNNAGSRIIKKGVGNVLGVVGIGSQSKKAKEENSAQEQFIPFEIAEPPDEDLKDNIPADMNESNPAGAGENTSKN